MDTSLLVATLLPCYSLPNLESGAPQMPVTLLVQARRLLLGLSADLLFYERAYALAVRRQIPAEIFMRAYHIRTAKAQILALNAFLEPTFT